jgi:hypothetical protein
MDNTVDTGISDYGNVRNTITGNVVEKGVLKVRYSENETIADNTLVDGDLRDYYGESNIVETNTLASIGLGSETGTIIRGVNDVTERLFIDEDGGTHHVRACEPNSYYDLAANKCKACPENTGTAPYGIATSLDDCDAMYFVLNTITSGQAAGAATLASAAATLNALNASQAATASAQGAALTALTASQATASTSVSALSAMVTALTANLAALQSNVTTSLAALQLIKRTPSTAPPSTTPGAPPSVVTDLPAGTPAFVTVTLSLGGYSTATFGTTQAAQLKSALAAATRVPASSVHVTGVRARANAGRRSLSQVSGVDVDVSIATTAGVAATALSSDLQTLTAAVLRAAGLVSCTDLALATAPGLSTSAPVDVVHTLPGTDAETTDGTAAAASKAEQHLDLLGLLVLLLLPAGGLGLWFVHKRAVNAAVAQAAAAAATDKQAEQIEQVAAPV